jgi:uncharacterized protein YfaS (alpha-2-macroglobulin family)
LQAGLGISRSKGWMADYGSALRDQALILALLQEKQPGQQPGRPAPVRPVG